MLVSRHTKEEELLGVVIAGLAMAGGCAEGEAG